MSQFAEGGNRVEYNKSQWKDIVTNKKLLIPIIAILFVPLIYSGVFLKAYWDPYGTVDQAPVVVVNQDKGADYEGNIFRSVTIL